MWREMFVVDVHLQMSKAALRGDRSHNIHLNDVSPAVVMQKSPSWASARGK